MGERIWHEKAGEEFRGDVMGPGDGFELGKGYLKEMIRKIDLDAPRAMTPCQSLQFKTL